MFNIATSDDLLLFCEASFDEYSLYCGVDGVEAGWDWI